MKTDCRLNNNHCRPSYVSKQNSVFWPQALMDPICIFSTLVFIENRIFFQVPLLTICKGQHHSRRGENKVPFYGSIDPHEKSLPERLCSHTHSAKEMHYTIAEEKFNIRKFIQSVSKFIQVILSIGKIKTKSSWNGKNISPSTWLIWNNPGRAENIETSLSGGKHSFVTDGRKNEIGIFPRKDLFRQNVFKTSNKYLFFLLPAIRKSSWIFICCLFGGFCVLKAIKTRWKAAFCFPSKGARFVI